MRDLNKCCSESCIKKDKRIVDGILQCNCGEDIEICFWRWSTEHSSSGTRITNNDKDILFHPCYSSGTAVGRGDLFFKPNLHYYWEVKMISNMYGTDVMVGVGTSKVEFADWRLKFCSLLGIDSDSWGYSYHGKIQHDKLIRKYGSNFGLGSIVGVYLDMCKGTLEYYLNRKPLGIAFTGMKEYELYPMVSSTAAQSAVRLVCAVSEEPTLQMLCLKCISKHKNLYKKYQNIPGLVRLYERKYFWIVPNYESDSAKRIAEIEDNLMCPLGYKNFLKTNKKLRTTWYSNDFFFDFGEDDSNLSSASSTDIQSDISNDSIKTEEKDESKLLDMHPSTSNSNCDESQNKIIDSNLNVTYF